MSSETGKNFASVGDWLADFGVREFSGRCTFIYQNDFDVTVQLTDDGETLFLSATLLALAENHNTVDFLKQVLQLSYLGIETQGASLSLDAAGRSIVLWHASSVSTLDAESFSQRLGSFLDTAEALRKRLQRAAVTGSSSSASGKSPTEVFDPSQSIRI